MADETSNHAPYRTDLTPEQRGRELVAALRALPAEGPTTLPGNGDFIWNYQYTLITRDDPRDEIVEAGGSGEYCGSIGCAVGLGYCLGLLTYLTYGVNTIKDELDLEGGREIFYSADTYGVGWNEVTPAMVADELERALDARWS